MLKRSELRESLTGRPPPPHTRPPQPSLPGKFFTFSHAWNYWQFNCYTFASAMKPRRRDAWPIEIFTRSQLYLYKMGGFFFQLYFSTVFHLFVDFLSTLKTANREVVRNFIRSTSMKRFERQTEKGNAPYHRMTSTYQNEKVCKKKYTKVNLKG